jgi:hypothetical protein
MTYSEEPDMPVTITTPVIGETLTVTAITIDPQSTEYRVAGVITDANGTPIKNIEQGGRVIDPDTLERDVPPDVDFDALYAALKTWAYWTLTKGEVQV